MTATQLAELLLKHCEGIGLVDLDDKDGMATIDGYFDLQAIVDEIDGRLPKTGHSHDIGATGPDVWQGRRRG